MKRTMILLASMALVASGFQAFPAVAAEGAPEIPAVVQIEDPLNDGNFINDQGNRERTGFQGDKAGPADGSSVGDLLKVWFTNDAENVSVHFQTEKPGPAVTSIVYQTYTNAGEGPKGANKLGCLRWYGLIPGAYSGQSTTYQGPPLIKLVDRCNDGTNVYSNGVEGKHEIAEGPEGTGILTMTFPRSYSPLLGGATLTAPFASTSLVAGAEAVGNTGVMIDNTANGTDYAFVTSAPTEPTAPGKNPVPGKKKGCDNGKGKKRGCEGPGKKAPKPGKPSNSCATFTPGEMGKEAKTTVVTDAATEDKPIEIDVPLGPATGTVGSDRTTRMKHNVQIDSTKSDAGLFARLEGPALDDPDLYVYWPSGSQAAVAGGFNPLLVAGPLPEAHAILAALNGTGKGGHSEFTAEQIDGLRTSDCQGWTLDLVNWAGRGGYKLKLWLGEVQNEPAAEQ